MNDMQRIPMNLQLFAEPGGDPAPTPAPNPSPAPAPAPAPKPDAESFAQKLLDAVSTAAARKEAAVTKSMAEQYGFSEDEAAAILKAHKDEQSKKLPEEVQKVVDAQLEKATGMLIAAEIKAQGAGLGLIDPDAALALLPKDARDTIKVDDKGAVTGVKEALEALKKAKPYLFGQAKAWGDKQGGVQPSVSGVEAAFLKKNPGLKVD